MDTVFFNGRAALLDFIGGVRDDFSERLDRFNASKSLQRSLRSEVSDGNSSIGQELSIFSRAAITTVTMTTNSNTIYGAAFTTIAAAGVWRIRKIAASTWVRL